MSVGRAFGGAGSTSGLTQSQVDARVTALATGLSQAAVDARVALLAPSDWKGEVPTEAARLAMTGLVAGDRVFQGDAGQMFALIRTPATTAANWEVVSAPDALVGASSTLPGVGGYPVAPLAGQHDLALFGDATWHSVAPDWQANRAYSVGAVVVSENSLFRRVAAGTSGAGWDATERLSWLRIGSAQAGTLTDVTPLPVPLGLTELEGFVPAADVPPGTQWIARTNAATPGSCDRLAMVVGGVWAHVGMTPLALVDKTPGLLPPTLVALTAQVNPATRPPWEAWEAILETEPGVYRTARVVNGAWVMADAGETSTSPTSIPLGIVVDVSPSPRPASLAALELLVPAATQQVGQVWEALIQPAPGVIRTARVLGTAWAYSDTAASGGAAVPMGGASATIAGSTGTVPGPLAGEQDAFLRGDGTWSGVLPDWVASRAYAGGAVAVNAGVIYRRLAAGTSRATFDATELALWTALGSAGAAATRVFVSNTLMAPVAAGQPTDAEATARVGANRNTLLYYTGTNTATDPITFAWWIDGAGVVSLLRSPTVTAGAMTGATATVVGTSGPVPVPAIGTHDLVLHGDGTWSGVAPDWVAARAYSAGAVVVNGGRLFRRIAAGTSGATFDAAEVLLWTALSSAAMTGATAGLAGTGGSVPTPVAAQQDTVLHGDGLWRELAPVWGPAVPYSQGAFVVVSGRLFKSNTARTSGATFDATEAAQWTELAPSLFQSQVVSLPNQATGGTLVAASTVNVAGVILVNQATPLQTISVPPPTDGQPNAYIIRNTGTASFTLAGVTGGTRIIPAAGSATLVFDGAQYLVTTEPVDTGAEFKGGWAAVAPFPGGGTAVAGDWYIVTAAGVVDGQSFTIGDQVYALKPNASTTTYATNWLRVPSAVQAPYVDSFVAADWVLVGADRVLTYPQATHVQGLTPFVSVAEVAGVHFDQINVSTRIENDGDVAISTPDGLQFDGRVIISAGLGGPSALAVGATLDGTIAGSAGYIGAPPAGSARQVLRGDNTFGNPVGVFETGAHYTAGAVIVDSGSLWQRTAAGVAGATFAADVANWASLSVPSTPLRTVTANTTVTANDEYVIVDTTAGDVTVTLPSGLTTGKRITFHKAVAANQMIVASANQVLSTFALGTTESFPAAYSSVTFVWTGAPLSRWNLQ
jgi:hypothetical protein